MYVFTSQVRSGTTSNIFRLTFLVLYFGNKKLSHIGLSGVFLQCWLQERINLSLPSIASSPLLLAYCHALLKVSFVNFSSDGVSQNFFRISAFLSRGMCIMSKSACDALMCLTIACARFSTIPLDTPLMA